MLRCRARQKTRKNEFESFQFGQRVGEPCKRFTGVDILDMDWRYENGYGVDVRRLMGF